MDLIEGEIAPLVARGISGETTKHFGYMKGQHKGQTVQIAPFYNADGHLVAQKIRTADKQFSWIGDQSEAMPFGFQSFPKAGRMLTLTEGEIDAMAMSQVQGNKWPVWAISCGAGPQVKKYLARVREQLLGFEKVVIMFDNDEPGRESAKLAAEIIGPTAWIADLPLKDAADMLKAGRVDELISAMWNPRKHRPEGIVELASLKEAVKSPVDKGLSYPWPQLTAQTYGIRLNELIALGAGTGVGKTDFFTQIMQHLVTVHNKPVGAFFLESTLVDLSRRLAGKFAGKTFHLPDSGWTAADLDTAWDALENGGKVFLYDSFGNNEWQGVKDKIEYLHHAEGVQHFFLDHLTALAAWQDDEQEALKKIMSELGSLVKKYPITIFFVSHLNTPQGKAHEEGGRVEIRNLRGSRAIGYWSTAIYGLERDQQAENVSERMTTTVRCLKHRLVGSSTGKTFFLGYEEKTGLLWETTPPDKRTAAAHGFTNDTTAPAEGPSDF